MRTLLSILLLLSIPTYGQSTLNLPAIKTRLAFIYDRDQKARQGGDSAQYRRYIDSTNLLMVEDIIGQMGGWPDRKYVGDYGNQAVWLVIQHADLKTQEKYFPMMQESVGRGESRPAELAYLEDRILMRKGMKQKYGSQVSHNQKTGAPEVWPIADEKNVNKRRAELFLQPMEDYAKAFGIEYRVPE